MGKWLDPAEMPGWWFVVTTLALTTLVVVAIWHG